MLPASAIKQFKQIYLKKFKRELNDAEACHLSSRLLNLYKAVYNQDIDNPKKNKNEHK